MLQAILTIIIVTGIYALIEYYGWQALNTVVHGKSASILKWVYWGSTISLLLFMVLYRTFLAKHVPGGIALYMFTGFVILLFSKIIILLFLLPEDIVRLGKYLVQRFSSSPPHVAGGITRSEFLSKMALVAAAIPAGTLIYGAIVNAYNYQYRRETIKFPNLPAAFNGLRIVQLSDIHSGSFTRTEPIIEAVEKINAMKPDVIFFTGDLVNNIADEMEKFAPIFGKLQAKYGVISITGNHDYGDYVNWDSKEEKIANFEKFKGIHAAMGWKLLLNENHIIEKDGEQIAVIGIENWGKGRFAKYGKMGKAYQGTAEIPFKILLSHDPSHWDVETRPKFPDIDLTLSGHTHGAQFGIESKWLRWSPSQYIYKKWAGLYQEGKQYLYVNRGFGFLAYPGRVGILPEVTEITLLRGNEA